MQVKGSVLVENRRSILIKSSRHTPGEGCLDFYLLMAGLLAARLQGPIARTHSRSAKMVFGL
jgi:hypothetical protein